MIHSMSTGTTAATHNTPNARVDQATQILKTEYNRLGTAIQALEGKGTTGVVREVTETGAAAGNIVTRRGRPAGSKNRQNKRAMTASAGGA